MVGERMSEHSSITRRYPSQLTCFISLLTLSETRVVYKQPALLHSAHTYDATEGHCSLFSLPILFMYIFFKNYGVERNITLMGKNKSLFNIINLNFNLVLYVFILPIC